MHNIHPFGPSSPSHHAQVLTLTSPHMPTTLAAQATSTQPPMTQTSKRTSRYIMPNVNLAAQPASQKPPHTNIPTITTLHNPLHHPSRSCTSPWPRTTSPQISVSHNSPVSPAHLPTTRNPLPALMQLRTCTCNRIETFLHPIQVVLRVLSGPLRLGADGRK
jgi:hypothetical protein